MSFDIEADGPIPMSNSMVQLGAVFYTPTGEEIATFSANIDDAPGCRPDPNTMAWWKEQFKKNPSLREGVFGNRKHVYEVMVHFCDLVRAIKKEHSCTIVPVAYPAGYDWTWLYTYIMHFGGQHIPAAKRCPLGFSCIDIKTMAFDRLGGLYKDAAKRNMPSSWFDKSLKHTHVALDDAREQGNIFFSMLRGIS